MFKNNANCCDINNVNLTMLRLSCTLRIFIIHMCVLEFKQMFVGISRTYQTPAYMCAIPYRVYLDAELRMYLFKGVRSKERAVTYEHMQIQINEFRFTYQYS